MTMAWPIMKAAASKGLDRPLDRRLDVLGA
jgi:hypothetical protein